MSLEKKQKQRIKRRKLRVRAKFLDKSKFRISVFRSSRQIYGQIIDDASGKTLVSNSSLTMFKDGKKENKNKTDIAKIIGLELAKKALEEKITNVCFDRSKFLYHGRVKSFAEGLREGGLKF